MVGVGYLLPMNESTIVEVDGKPLRLTHLSKVMFPDDGFTKAELLLYYQTVTPPLLPHLRGRPLTLKAFPNGVTSILPAAAGIRGSPVAQQS